MYICFLKEKINIVYDNYDEVIKKKQKVKGQKMNNIIKKVKRENSKIVS